MSSPSACRRASSSRSNRPASTSSRRHSKLLAFFPTLDFDPAVRDEYDRVAITEVERIRDFVILHYKLTQRDDSAL
jgi:hypothetical protein